MTFRRPLAILSLALVLAACSKKDDALTANSAAPTVSGPVTAVPPPAGKSWTDVVEATPQDGYRMGNPNAPIKIVEYASFTCPHCRKFEADGADILQSKYISTGKVSWEFRSTVIHGPDAPVTLLMACRGAEPYFKLAQQLYATQDTWFGMPVIDKLNAGQAQMQALSPTDQFKKLIDTMGLYSFFAARGLPRAQADACLTDQKAVDKLTATQARYTTQDGVTGTPTFVINGSTWNYETTGESVWNQLQPMLDRMTR